MNTKRVALLGCGRLGEVIAKALLVHTVDHAELVCIYVRSPEKAQLLHQKLRCPVVTDIQALLDKKPDYVIEAATKDAVQEFAVPIMEAGADLIVLSTSALGDPNFYRQAYEAAERVGRRIHLAHGVVGGLDTVEAASMMGDFRAEITKRKFARGSEKSDAALDALDDAFHGTAEDVRRLFPEQLNVAVSLGLAAGNLFATNVHVAPSDRVDFTICCEGTFGEASFYTRLGAFGPDLAAWSALAMLRRQISRITF